MKGNRYKIYCLMWRGPNLSDAACDALFCAACDCVKYKKHERKVINDDVEGIVHTEYQHGALGSIGGIVFYGDIETEQGTDTVTYLVTTNELEEARNNKTSRWVSWEDFMKEMRKTESYKWN